MPVELDGIYLPIEEAANLAGVSKSYISRMIRKGRLVAKRVGDMGYLIVYESFMLWLSSRGTKK